MRERWRWTWPWRHDYTQGPPALEIGLFVGWDVLVGVSGERHPNEWTFALHLPFMRLIVERVR